MNQRRKITIRQYAPEDLETIIDIFVDAVRNVASRDYSPEQVDAWAQADPRRWTEKLESRSAWIAEVDGKPAGWVDLEPDGHLDMLFVHSAFQGIGVASALLSTVDSAARQAKLDRIFTEASITARPAFEKRGYEVICEQTVESRGQQFRNYRMQKRLSYN